MSANAFAQQAANASKSSSIRGENDDHGPPAKRPRLSNEARFTIETHTAAEDTALEVDHMILDYLAYQATTACLASRDIASHTQKDAHRKENVKAPSDQNLSLANNLAMADSFVTIFKTRHPDYAWDDELRFRLRLLQFTTLFTQRLTRNPSTPHTSVLQNLRKANETRAMEWIGTADRIPSSRFDHRGLETVLPLPAPELERNRAHVLHALQAPAEEEHEPPFYGTTSSVSLLDLFPLFMRVSADLHSLLDRQPTDFWRELAANFMLQATLEQYLVRGSEGTDAVDNAFAWGEKTPSLQSDEDEDHDPTLNMFNHWKRIKNERLTTLFSSPTPKDLIAHLEKVGTQNPIAAFEAGILEYLAAVIKSVPAPVLIQREKGKLDDLPIRETREFFAKTCGV